MRVRNSQMGTVDLREYLSMKSIWRKAASILFSILGSLAWCYVGGWLVLTGPVKGIAVAYAAGKLTLGKLLSLVLEVFIYLSLAGGVWCIGYMLSNHFKK